MYENYYTNATGRDLCVVIFIARFLKENTCSRINLLLLHSACRCDDAKLFTVYELGCRGSLSLSLSLASLVLSLPLSCLVRALSRDGTRCPGGGASSSSS